MITPQGSQLGEGPTRSHTCVRVGRISGGARNNHLLLANSTSTARATVQHRVRRGRGTALASHLQVPGGLFGEKTLADVSDEDYFDACRLTDLLGMRAIEMISKANASS